MDCDGSLSYQEIFNTKLQNENLRRVIEKNKDKLVLMTANGDTVYNQLIVIAEQDVHSSPGRAFIGDLLHQIRQRGNYRDYSEVEQALMRVMLSSTSSPAEQLSVFNGTKNYISDPLLREVLLRQSVADSKHADSWLSKIRSNFAVEDLSSSEFGLVKSFLRINSKAQMQAVDSLIDSLMGHSSFSPEQYLDLMQTLELQGDRARLHNVLSKATFDVKSGAVSRWLHTKKKNASGDEYKLIEATLLKLGDEEEQVREQFKIIEGESSEAEKVAALKKLTELDVFPDDMGEDFSYAFMRALRSSPHPGKLLDAMYLAPFDWHSFFKVGDADMLERFFDENLVSKPQMLMAALEYIEHTKNNGLRNKVFRVFAQNSNHQQKAVFYSKVKFSELNAVQRGYFVGGTVKLVSRSSTEARAYIWDNIAKNWSFDVLSPEDFIKLKEAYQEDPLPSTRKYRDEKKAIEDFLGIR